MPFLSFSALQTPAFGLDISDASLKIVALKRRGQDLDLAAFGEEPLPAGLVVRGEIVDEKPLAEAVRRLLKNARGGKIASQRVVAALPEEKSFLRMIQMPRMSIPELTQALSFEAENYIPLPSNETYFDFQIIEPVINHLDHLDVLLAAAPRVLADAYLRVLKLAGLEPVAFETESLALGRALVKNCLAPRPILLVNLGATKTVLAIFSGRTVRFTSSLDFSSRQLTEILSRKLGVDLARAEKIKLDYGLSAETRVKLAEKTGDAELEKELLHDDRLIRVLSEPATGLASEIRNFLDFYYAHATHEHLYPNGHQINRMFLSGGGARLKGLTEFLSRQLGLTVLAGNPWVNILTEPRERVPEPYLSNSLSYAVVLGLALRGILEQDHD